MLESAAGAPFSLNAPSCCAAEIDVYLLLNGHEQIGKFKETAARGRPTAVPRMPALADTLQPVWRQ
ncbi:MAG TPA: hypothetical protein DDW52_30190 [Planctomycetaceae bacterium]|nr:hypothetical protein [Planctomycetaceae bacterium]